MIRRFCLLFMLLTSCLSAADPIVFISSFAAGEKAGIHAFSFDSAAGQLTPLHTTTDIQHPFYLALSPDHRFLYAVDAEKFGGEENEQVASFAIEGRTGKLRRLGQVSSQGTATCYLETDTSGKCVLAANYSSGSVLALPVKPDGSLGEASSFHQHTGSSIHPDRQKGPNAHSIVISPDNRFALAADLGTDKIMIYALDAEAGKLSPNAAQAHVAAKPGAGPRHITFHPNGTRVYVINELSNTVSVYDYSKEDGRLKDRQSISTLPADFQGTSYTADLKVTPDGKFLYGTNRGHDSIASYSIADDGSLTLLAIQPSLGKGPQNLFITPDGRWLLLANMPGNSLIVFKIDGQTGALTTHGDPISLPMPSCIRWME
jgi:6-phosphogluconolactonase